MQNKHQSTFRKKRVGLRQLPSTIESLSLHFWRPGSSVPSILPCECSLWRKDYISQRCKEGGGGSEGPNIYTWQQGRDGETYPDPPALGIVGSWHVWAAMPSLGVVKGRVFTGRNEAVRPGGHGCGWQTQAAARCWERVQQEDSPGGGTPRCVLGFGGYRGRREGTEMGEEKCCSPWQASGLCFSVLASSRVPQCPLRPPRGCGAQNGFRESALHPENSQPHAY